MAEDKFPVRKAPNGAAVMVLTLGVIPMAAIAIPGAAVAGAVIGGISSLFVSGSTFLGYLGMGALIGAGTVTGGAALFGGALLLAQLNEVREAKRTEKKIKEYIARQNKIRPRGYTREDYNSDLTKHHLADFHAAANKKSQKSAVPPSPSSKPGTPDRNP